MLNELMRMFLGNSPKWYKSTIIAFLILNPFILLICNSMGLNGGFIVGWIFLLQDTEPLPALDTPAHSWKEYS